MLATGDRLLLGHSWLQEARAEYASIASFVQLAKELARLGAPLGLIRRAYVAAQDEVRHADLCFDLASHYLGARVHPEPLPPVAVRPSTTHRSLALECWLDGCLGEGAAAHLAKVRAARTTEPHTRAALSRIAGDEAEHAELGWDVLQWCLRQAPAGVRDALRCKPDPSCAPADPAHRRASLQRLARHGLFEAADFNAALTLVRRHAHARLDTLLTHNALRLALGQRVAEHARVEQRVDLS